MYSPRNGIELHHVMASEVVSVDTLFEICDAEFTSRLDVADSFMRAKGAKSWARQYLLREVQKVASRENISCSQHLGLIIATKLANIWFEHSQFTE